MSEHEKSTQFSAQKETRPKIDGFIEKLTDDEMKNNVLNLIEYCKTNKFSLAWGATNKWFIRFKNKTIGTIRLGGMQVGRKYLDENTWEVSASMDINSAIYKEYSEKEDLTKIIWQNVKRCDGCLTSCAPGHTITVLGKEFSNVCGYGICYTNPDTATLNCIKKLLELRKELIIENKA